MNNFLNMVNIQSQLFIYMIVGIYARKMNIITEKTRQSFVDLLIQITLPCMIFNSFNQEFSIDKMRMASLSLVFAFGVCLMEFILGKFIYNRYSVREKAIMQYGTLVSNSGFAGLPLVAAAYGNEALFYASIFIIPTRIFMWSAGISIFTTATFKTKVKNVMLNPGIIAVEIGLLFMIFQIPLYPVLSSAIKNIGNVTSPLSMMIVGVILADIDIKSVLQKNVFYLSFIRLILLPALLLLVLKLIHVDNLVLASSVILTGMPVGATTAILAEKYGADYKFASRCVFVSTVISLVTAPLLTLFF